MDRLWEGLETYVESHRLFQGKNTNGQKLVGVAF